MTETFPPPPGIEYLIYTVVAREGHQGAPYTIGSYSTLDKARAAVVMYYGTRAQLDMDATPICLATVATYRCMMTNIYINVHDLDDRPNA